MLPKPSFLGPDLATQFSDESVVAAYGHRPPYPDEIFGILNALVVEPRTLLDIGTGTGKVARRLAATGLLVDAVDPSPGMLARGRELPGGDHSGLTWILGGAEDVPLGSEYGLITAASSLQWMDWAVVLPRLRDVLARDAVLAIVEERAIATAWTPQLQTVIGRYSTNRDFRRYDLMEELKQRRLFREIGRRRTEPVPFRQPMSAYIESFHARNGLSRERMLPADARAFDRAVEHLVLPYVDAGNVKLTLVAEVIWGEPAPG